ncbi:MAG: hypothetical protein IAE95_08315 [Chitinophagaceae bacterium]|nr:hypothetical protein [Chitinophagaceae bacterium]
MRRIITTLTLAVLLAGTVSAQETPGPHLIVYKTKKNYRDQVPVLLSDDKSSIISYPAPADIKAMGKKVYPTTLTSGYLIDNRGIGTNVAFLKLSYSEYAKLKTVPTVDKLYKMIKDKDPITEMCDCGLKMSFKEPQKEVNVLIKAGELRRKCKVLTVGKR